MCFKKLHQFMGLQQKLWVNSGSGQVTHGVKQSDFKHIIAPVTIGLSGDQIYFTIQALYNPRREGFFRLEPIHHQVLMSSNRLDELFHRLQFGTHRPSAPKP